MMIRSFGSSAALFLLASLAAVVPFVPAADNDLPADLVLTLKGHSEPVYSIAYSGDGKYIVTGSGEPSIKVWEAATGKEVKTFAGSKGHKGLIVSLAVSPDGTQFATGGADNTARVWDFPGANSLREFATSAEPRAVAVSADGQRAAGGSKDGKIRLWTTQDGKQLHELSGHTGAITGLAFSPNGQILASVSEDTTLRYWNVNDGKMLASFAAHPGEATGVSFNPGGNLVYTTGKDGTLRFWTQPPTGTRSLQAALPEAVRAVSLSPDGGQIVVGAGKLVRLATLSTGQTVRDFAGSQLPITSVATTSGGGLVAAGSSDRKLLVWQGKDGKLLMDQPAHNGAITGVALHPSGTQVATVGKDGLLRLFALPTSVTEKIVHPDAVRAAVLTPDSKRVVTGGLDKTVRIYRLDNPKAPERQLTGHATAIHALALSADGKTLVSGAESGLLRIWKLDKADPSATLGAHGGPVTSVQWFGNDRVLSTSKDGSVKLWQAATTLTGKSTLAHAGNVTCQTLTSDGNRLITGSEDKQVRQWNLTNGQLERTWTGPTLGIVAVALSPKGDRVAATSADKALFVWEAASNKLVQKIGPLPAVAAAVALTADSKLALAGLADGTLRLYDLTTGKEIRSLDGHKGAIAGLVVTPRGDQVITAGQDGNLLLRNLAGGPPVRTIPHGGAIQGLALTRDGNRLAAAGKDKQVKLYTLATGKMDGSFVVAAEVNDLAFSPDGKKLAVVGGDVHARIYSVEGQLEEYFTHGGIVRVVSFSPDGKKLISSGADKSARVWMPSLIWQGRHEGGVSQALLSPRGDRVASAGEDGLVRFWNPNDGKPLASLRTHAGTVAGLSFTADANRLVSAGADKSARVWDLTKIPANKMATKDLDQPAVALTLPHPALSVSITPNGQRIAVGLDAAGKEQVRIYDSVSGKELLSLGEDGTMPARTISFLPDSRMLLTAGTDRTVRLEDVNILTAIDAHAGGCTDVAFHDNGTQVVTGGADKSVKLWTLATGKLERTFGPMAAGIEALSLARGGSQVAATSAKTLKVWNVGDGKETLSLEMPAAARGVSFNSDRTRLATAGVDGRVRVWDVALKLEQQAFLHTGPASGVAFHPSTQTLLVSAGEDKTVGVHTLSAQRTVVLGAAVQGLAVTTNSAHILAACADGKVKVVNAGSGNIDRICEAGDKPVTSVAVTRNNQLIAAGSIDNKLRLFTYNDGKLLSAFTTPTETRSVTFSPDNQAVVAACRNGTLLAWDVTYNPGQPLPAEFGKVQQTYQHGTIALEVAFPNNGAIFYSAGLDGQIRAWKLASESPLRTFSHPGSVNAIVYDREGKILATGAGDGKMRIFDAAKGNQIREINAHPVPNNEGAIYGVALSPDGKTIVSASKDHSLKLFNVADGKLIREFKAYKEKESPRGHQDAVLCVAFSPDGQQIASGSADKTIKIWNVADGSVVRDFVNPGLKSSMPNVPAPSHPGWVYALRWTEGGKKLLSVGGAPRLHGYVASWEVASGRLLQGRELNVGTIFTLAVSPDDKVYALGTGGSVRSERDLNLGLIVKMPK